MREKIHKVNKITALLLVLIFTLGLAAPAWAEGESVSTDSNNEQITYKTGANPLWTIDNIEILNEPAVGEQFDIAITSRNMGSGDAVMPII